MIRIPPNAGTVALVAVLALGACSSAKGGQPTAATASTVATQTRPALISGPPPWPGPASGVSALAAEAGLPMLPAEALVEHIHAHLDVYYDGQQITVPAYIGIDLAAGSISPLHTHDTTGIVHIESPTVKPYYLGQFLTEWGLQAGSGCLAGQCPPAHPVSVFVNGVPSQLSIEKVELTAHAEIVVAVGAVPATVPTKYSFPSGY